MKILLIGNYINDQQESMQRFALMLKHGLLKAGHEVTLVNPVSFFGTLKKNNVGFGKLLGYFDKFLIFPLLLRRLVKNTDVVHICDHSNAFYTKYVQAVPHLTTCHDMLAISGALGEVSEHQTRWSGRLFQKLILNGINSSMFVVCISEMTKNDLLRISSLGKNKVKVIHMGFNYPYSIMDRTEAITRLTAMGVDHTKPFILHVGGNQWYKNRIGVLDIFRHLVNISDFFDFNIIMAGKPLTNTMRDFAHSNNIASRILEINNATNEDLRALYSLAVALLFPSFKEGFGWPVIEAQACGCPVITSNVEPLREVGGDAAIYIDPKQPELAAKIIAKNVKKFPLLHRSGLVNAERFSTDKMINSYINVYKALLGV